MGCVAENSTIWGMAKMLHIIMTLNIIIASIAEALRGEVLYSVLCVC